MIFLVLCIIPLSIIAEIPLFSHTDIEIVELEQQYIQQAKEIFYHIVYEFQLMPCSTIQDVQHHFIRIGVCKDYDDANGYYFNNRGTFLVVLHQGKVVGTGAFKFFDDTTCELKRFYFFPEYRSKGLGSTLMLSLIDRARTFGYKKIILEVYNPIKQYAAINFYKQWGFYEIAAYRESNAQLQMELKL